jgi:hypothetical protein
VLVKRFNYLAVRAETELLTLPQNPQMVGDPMNTNEEKERETFQADWNKRPFWPADTSDKDRAFHWWQAGRAALRAESEPVMCERCKGTGVDGYIDHGFAHYGDEAIEPNRCQMCDGFGYTAPQTEPKGTGSEI